ncbi:MAG: hypothetical protein E7180_04100 [Erysipelotrichaceae bacterium]|nr:hypothetical protein [Erysipelotrichaceae bacterium]
MWWFFGSIILFGIIIIFLVIQKSNANIIIRSFIFTPKNNLYWSEEEKKINKKLDEYNKLKREKQYLESIKSDLNRKLRGSRIFHRENIDELKKIISCNKARIKELNNILSSFNFKNICNVGDEKIELINDFKSYLPQGI